MCERITPRARMQFDHWRANRARGLDRLQRWFDKQRDANSGLEELGGDNSQMVMSAGDVEPSFGGALGAFFRDKAAGVRAGIESDRHHVVSRRHLEVERLKNLPLQPRHVFVANVAPVLTEMGGDAIGASFNGKMCRMDGIREGAAPRIAQGRDMINIDTEAYVMRHIYYPFTRSTLLTTGRARKCDMMVFKCFKSRTSTSIINSRKSAEIGLMTILSILAA